ncbi:hypothetical protein Mapa_016924 [Marchantia paleacea]|nr:hypothetical protein Mapa_016924 [Marchantia paleacea]
MPWRQGMKVCLWRTTKHVLVIFCILSSLCTIQGQCPSGWQEGPVDQRCFTLMNNASSWNESAVNCKAEGGHLAAVASAQEFPFLDGLCTSNGSGSCWLGGTLQRSSSGIFTPNWTDCRVPWNDSFYPPGPPLPSTNCSDPSCPDYHENGWCSLVLNSSLVWGSCDTKHSFICSLGEDGSCGGRSSNKAYIITLSVVSSVILTTTLGVTIWLLAYRRTKRRRRRRRDQSTLAASAASAPAWRVYTFSEVVNFTDGFAPENKLGRGGDSDSFTYKGALPDGSAVAIRKVRRPGLQGEKDFLAEMRKIGRLRHENLVAMKGCCFDRNDGFIIYEFIPNGTLDDWIHNLPSGARPLDWDARMRIAEGVADSLAYLHDKVKPNVVHRNVRSSTVLLDNDFKPHLLGVGLVNMALRDTTHEPTVIVGTHGYLAPEFVYRNELTTRSDIFSFGVLLLELVTGRKPTVAEGEISETPTTIFEWATPLLQAEAWTELLDVTIGTVPNYSQVKKVVELAYTCTQHVPSMRPRMSHVLYQLQELQRAELVVQPMMNTERTTIPLNTESLGDNTTDLELEIREVPL